MANWLNKIGEFADQHVKEIGYIKYAVGLVGIGLIAKHTHITRKINKVSDIPPSFVRKHTRLQGIVKQVSPAGVLHVDHIPIMTLKWFRKSEGALLPVSLSGIDIQEKGVEYLEENLHNQHVWFKLININNGTVDCIVKYKKSLFTRIQLNEYLVSQGLSKVHHVDDLVQSNLHDTLMDRLIKAELKAEKSGKGIWVKPTMSERLQDYRQEKVSIVKASISGAANSAKERLSFYKYFSKLTRLKENKNKQSEDSTRK